MKNLCLSPIFRNTPLYIRRIINEWTEIISVLKNHGWNIQPLKKLEYSVEAWLKVGVLKIMKRNLLRKVKWSYLDKYIQNLMSISIEELVWPSTLLFRSRYLVLYLVYFRPQKITPSTQIRKVPQKPRIYYLLEP